MRTAEAARAAAEAEIDAAAEAAAVALIGDITRASGTDAAKQLPAGLLLSRASLRGRASLADASGCLQRLGVSKKQYFAAAEFLDLAAQVRASVGRAPVTLTAQSTAEWVGRLRALLAPVADLGADASPGLLAPGVYLGSYAHAQMLELLASLGVTAVLNCAPSMCDDPVAKYEARGWSYAAVDAQDDSYPLLDQHLPAAREPLSAALDEGVVFIHCFQGVNRRRRWRRPSWSRGRRRRCWRWRRVLAARPIILRNGGFCKQLVGAAASGLLR